MKDAHLIVNTTQLQTSVNASTRHYSSMEASVWNATIQSISTLLTTLASFVTATKSIVLRKRNVSPALMKIPISMAPNAMFALSSLSGTQILVIARLAMEG